MADTNPAEDTLTHLHRLASRPGIQSTLILSRHDGAIVRATGLLTAPSTTGQDGQAQEEDEAQGTAANAVDEASRRRPDSRREDKEGKSGMKDAEQVAAAVWRFFKAAGDTALEMGGVPTQSTSNGDARDAAKGKEGEEGRQEGNSRGIVGDDEVKLLRLRLRRSEVVVVPDPKFLLVVIHDTPPA